MQAQTRDLRGIHWRLACVCNTPLKDLLDGFRPDQLNGLPQEVIDYANGAPGAIVPIITVMEGQNDNEFELKVGCWICLRIFTSTAILLLLRPQSTVCFLMPRGLIM